MPRHPLQNRFLDAEETSEDYCRQIRRRREHVVDGDKFSLSWRAGQPVLDYVMRGFWTPADGQGYVEAFRAAIAKRPEGNWYMFGDLTAMKPQSDEVNALRNEASRLALEARLSGCVVVSTSTVAKMQMQRLQADASVKDLVQHCATVEEGEAALSQMIAGQART